MVEITGKVVILDITYKTYIGDDKAKYIYYS